MKPSTQSMRQAALKPQDVVTAVRLALGRAEDTMSYARLGESLAMSASEAHASVQRGVLCGLVVREFGELHANRTALFELLVHGLRYVFPPIFGPMVRGLRTSAYVGTLADHFPKEEGNLIVWPDDEGPDRGLSLCPLYPAVPIAAKRDPRLHESLALVDAVRSGSARERELAINLLQESFR